MHTTAPSTPAASSHPTSAVAVATLATDLAASPARARRRAVPHLRTVLGLASTALVAAPLALALALTSPSAPAAAAPAPGAGPATPSTSAAPAASATGPVTEWTLGPADATGPDDRVSLRHEVEPGTTVEDHVAVTNLGSTPGSFVVEAGDGVTSGDGAFDVRTDSEGPESVSTSAPDRAPASGSGSGTSAGSGSGSGSWIALGGLDADGRLALQPGETRVLPVTVTVPADATPGDHPAGIVAGVTTADAVSVSHRIGVRLHLRVAGEVRPELSVTDVRTTFAPSWVPFAPGTAEVSYRVSNEGNVRVGAAPRIAAGGPFGLGAATATGEQRELLPGESVTQTVSLAALPVVLLAGDLHVAPVALGEDALPAADAATADLAGLALSWTGLALVLLVATAGVLLTVRARRRRRAASAA